MEGRAMINLCLFGAGRIARVHAANVAAHAELALRTVVDLDLERARALAEPLGARAGSDADAALADPEVHAVLIASTSSTHADLIMRALAAKKPVFCEKPIDLDVERANACVRTVEAAGVPVFVDFNRRFDPHHAAVYQAVRAGEAGAVELVAITSVTRSRRRSTISRTRRAPCSARPWCTTATWPDGCSARSRSRCSPWRAA
jgi:myo-inositol 2-dehydrogenase/D-chiro-inositol 1-dehydrogenase